MKRVLTSALAAAVLTAAVGGEASAQDMSGKRASVFDLGVYAGGAWSSAWFTTPEAGGTGDDGWSVGLAPIFGVQATYWASPVFGVRLNTAFMPSDAPDNGDLDLFESGDYPINNWFYDVNLVYRPFFYSGGRFLSSTYLFLGGGGLTMNQPGSAETLNASCSAVPLWLANGICLSDDPSYSTVGQGVVGFGFDVLPLSRTFALFGEVAVHGYDSPAHVGDEPSSPGFGQDKFAFTPRAVLGLKARFGDILPPPPPPVVPPVVPVTPPVVPVTPPPPPPQPTINVCVVSGGALQNVTAQYNPATGDTTVNGRRFRDAYPTDGQYAAGATWYINNDAVTFQGRRYVKYGLPRVLGVTEVTRAGDVQGVSAFVEAGATGAPEVIYLPVRPGCEFQPYQTEIKTGGVRG